VENDRKLCSVNVFETAADVSSVVVAAAVKLSRGSVDPRVIEVEL
jgi:hypothetical protein